GGGTGRGVLGAGGRDAPVLARLRRRGAGPAEHRRLPGPGALPGPALGWGGGVRTSRARGGGGRTSRAWGGGGRASRARGGGGRGRRAPGGGGPARRGRG